MLLEVKNLCSYFQIGEKQLKAVENCTFSICEEDILGIVGESGAGKSVLAKSIMGLLDPPGYVASGDIFFKGNNLVDMDEKQLRQIRGREIAYLIQNPMASFNPMFSIGHHLKSVLRLYGTDKKKIDKQMIELLKSVNIENPEKLRKCYPHQFSGGMLQRVAIAMALAGNPKILIADEPTTALDANIRRDILMLLQKLSKDKHMSIVLITHDLAIVKEICNKICVMNSGRIVESGDTYEVCENPKDLYTRFLLENQLRVLDRQYGEQNGRNYTGRQESDKDVSAEY